MKFTRTLLASALVALLAACSNGAQDAQPAADTAAQPAEAATALPRQQLLQLQKA